MKLTSREQEIVEVLSQDPLASQEDLAIRFGISRSSVGVHISNLMKKGVILGKGYVFNKKVSAVVVGEALLRIDVNQNDNSNRIDTNYAGFALEVSRALVGLGMVTKLLTVMGTDELGSQILHSLKNQEVDISNVIRSDKYRTPRRIYVNNVARYSESIANEQFYRQIESHEWLMHNCDWLLIDEQFQELVTNKMFSREEQSPNLCACSFVEGELPEYLKQYNLLVLGVAHIQQMERLYQLGQSMVQGGVQNCIITDGSSMILQISEEGSQDFTLPPNQSFNSQSDLHLFLAGLVYGLSMGYPMRQALRIATGNASNHVL